MNTISFKKFFTRAVLGAGCLTMLGFGTPVMADGQIQASTETAASVSASSASKKTQKTKTGWVTNKNGWKRYYKNGKYLVGRHKVHGKYYYFGSNGYMKKSKWVTIKEKKYYFGWKGVGCIGLTKISGKWYYFDKYGALKTSNTTVDNVTYYIDDSGNVEAYKKKGVYYNPSGTKMDSESAANFETLQYAKAVVAQITTSSMSKSQKLLTCFNWVIKHYYKTTHVFTKQENWPSLYANDYLQGGKYGSCFSDSCSFAFLAKALGYENIYICLDTTGTKNAHCFVEINGLYYDPLFAEAKSFSANYAAPASVYALSPRVKVAL